MIYTERKLLAQVTLLSSEDRDGTDSVNDNKGLLLFVLQLLCSVSVEAQSYNRWFNMNYIW